MEEHKQLKAMLNERVKYYDFEDRLQVMEERFFSQVNIFNPYTFEIVGRESCSI